MKSARSETRANRINSACRPPSFAYDVPQARVRLLTLGQPEQPQAAFPDDDDHEWLRKKEAETTVTVLLDKLAAAGVIRSKVIGDGSGQ